MLDIPSPIYFEGKPPAKKQSFVFVVHALATDYQVERFREIYLPDDKHAPVFCTLNIKENTCDVVDANETDFGEKYGRVWER